MSTDTTGCLGGVCCAKPCPSDFRALANYHIVTPTPRAAFLLLENHCIMGNRCRWRWKKMTFKIGNSGSNFPVGGRKKRKKGILFFSSLLSSEKWKAWGPFIPFAEIVTLLNPHRFLAAYRVPKHRVKNISHVKHSMTVAPQEARLNPQVLC